MGREVVPYDYLTYGTACDAAELVRFLEHTLDVDAALEAKGARKTPVCIWGRHGIGKTQIVEGLCRARGMALVKIAPAQFEEMGDLLGMPVVVDQGRATKLAPPEWVPRGAGPGVLLVDDVNRADDRILRGLMPLFEEHALVGWSLPPRWHIVLTANPDGGDYSVTPMDDAMLTRMLHVTLRFEVKRWAAWAEEARVDPRGIAFVLAYPEAVTGTRTTARTLVQFFDRIASIEDLRANLELVTILGEACLDQSTVSAFIGFVENNLVDLVSPEEILAAKKTAPLEKKLERLAGGRTSLRRVDLLAAVGTRLVNHLALRRAPLTDAEIANLSAFFALEVFPADMRLAFAQELTTLPAKLGVSKLLASPAVARLLLQRPAP